MNRVIDWYFPFALAALILCGTQLFQPIFNPSTRWMFVLLAFLLAWISPAGGQSRRSSMFPLIILYLMWCMMTITWSDMMELSFYKASAAFLVFTGMYSIGYIWMIRAGDINSALSSLKWLIPSVMIVAVSGKVGQGLLERGGEYYAGLTGNPNNLGWMIAIVLPFIVYKVFDNHHSKQYRWTYLLVAGVSLYYLLQSQSRAAMLLSFFSLFGYFVSSGMAKRIKMAGLALFLLCGTILLIPNFFDFFYSEFVLKGTGQNIAYAIEQSRGGLFRESLEAAGKGSFTGAGYGVSIDANPHNYRGGLSAVGYGREKVISPLAIVEETGWIGLVLVLLLIGNLFRTIIRAYIAADPSERPAMGMFAGLLVGMMVHTCFEAWWVAPGAPESLFFWGYSGMLYALSLTVLKRAYTMGAGIQRFNSSRERLSK